MKLSLAPLMSALVLAGAVNTNAATYEWDLNGNTNPSIGTGTLSILSGTPATSYGTTTINGASDQYLNVPKMTSNANEGLTLTLNASSANGGGSYINQYTLVEDLFVPSSDAGSYVALLQTNPSNPSGNDADLYINSNGTIGDAGLGGYSTTAIAYNTWNRITFSVNLTANTASIYDNGNLIYTSTATLGVDGRYSLDYDGSGPAQTAPDVLLFNEGDSTTGTYTEPVKVSAIGFQDSALTAAQVAALGGPNAKGIFTVPEPGSVSLAILGSLALLAFGAYRSTRARP